ncbi:MAG: hypothetical protein A2202_08165 [Bdellovibrionales bacterium RIFOXYA1_FULL_36_14]|nr:MAG: hypothetical protein A2202_08165 [Bdellovibrionales bacterium RIFOXYA1_FULL_36_14]
MSKIKYILIFTLSVLITIVLLGSAPIQKSQEQTAKNCQQQITELSNEYHKSFATLQSKHTILEGEIDEKIFANGLLDINRHYQAFLYEVSLKKIDNSKELKNFLESKLNTIAMMSTFTHFIDYLGQDKQIAIDHAKEENDQVLEKFFAAEREKCQKHITDALGQKQCSDDYLSKTVPAITFFYKRYKHSSTDPKERKADLKLYQKALHQNLPSFDKHLSPMHLTLEFMKKLDQEKVSKKNQYHFTRYKNNLSLNVTTHKSAYVESRYGDLDLISKHYQSNKSPNPVRENYLFAQLKQNAINTPDQDLDLNPFFKTTINEIYSHVLNELGCFNQELTPTKKEYPPAIFKMKAPKQCLEEYAKMNKAYAPNSSELLEKINKMNLDFSNRISALDCKKKPEVIPSKTKDDCFTVVDQPLINFAEINLRIAQHPNTKWAVPLDLFEQRVTPIEKEKKYQKFQDYFEERWGEYKTLSKKPSATLAELEKEYQASKEYFKKLWDEYLKRSKEQSANPTKPEQEYQSFQDYIKAQWGEYIKLSKEPNASPIEQEQKYQTFQEYLKKHWGEHIELSQEPSSSPAEQISSTPPEEEEDVIISNQTQSLPTVEATGDLPPKAPSPTSKPNEKEEELLNLYEPPKDDLLRTPIRHLVDRNGKHIASGSVSQLSNKYHITIDPATGKLLFKPRRGMWDLLNGALPNTQLYQSPQRYTSIWVGELSGLNKGTINRQVMYSQLAIQQDHWARQIYNIQSMLNWQPYSPYAYNTYTGLDLSYKSSDYSDYTKQYIRDRGLPYLNEY